MYFIFKRMQITFTGLICIVSKKLNFSRKIDFLVHFLHYGVQIIANIWQRMGYFDWFIMYISLQMYGSTERLQKILPMTLLETSNFGMDLYFLYRDR